MHTCITIIIREKEDINLKIGIMRGSKEGSWEEPEASK